MDSRLRGNDVGSATVPTEKAGTVARPTTAEPLNLEPLNPSKERNLWQEYWS